MKNTCRVLALSILTSAFAFSQGQDFSKVEIKVHKVAGNVYMLEGSGGNIGVSVGEDGIVIVDNQFAPLAPKIKAALRGITDKPLKFVLNTHLHGDHSGGNEVFGREATIVAHENVRKRMKDAPATASQPAVPKHALPIVTFNDKAAIHVNGEDIRAIHLPNGHTDGDSIVYFQQSNVVHMGDEFVTYGFPFVDTQSGGTVSGMIAGITNALNLLPANVKVIPGHGPVSTTADVRKFLDMLRDTRAIVQSAVQNKKTPAQMKSERILQKYESYGAGFIKADAWIDVLYADVISKQAAGARYHNHGHAHEHR